MCGKTSQQHLALSYSLDCIHHQLMHITLLVARYTCLHTHPFQSTVRLLLTDPPHIACLLACPLLVLLHMSQLKSCRLYMPILIQPCTVLHLHLHLISISISIISMSCLRTFETLTRMAFINRNSLVDLAFKSYGGSLQRTLLCCGTL